MNAPFQSSEADMPGSARRDEKTIARALFRSMGVDGVVARTQDYETAVERLAALISRERDADAEVLRFPPAMSRKQLEKSGYLKSFPNLLGCVCALHGSEAEINGAVATFEKGGDWTASLTSADLVLSPAACYPVYPIAAERGLVPALGYVFDIAADVFRHEPSTDIDRFQSFRMREFVRIGTAEQVSAFREVWMTKAQEMARRLMLPFAVEQASDPFFGRVGQMMAVAQIQAALKFELLIPVRSAEMPTACMSFNYHKEHFGLAWDMRLASGEPAHSGCVAFGMDRLAVALFAVHGIDFRRWPGAVRQVLNM
ncbi:MAG: amino acid--[acyl-carrier-protein] ligase [Rhizobiales bacterium]|nr:amino acid--[acyl-carrier-protein] ligase [Hyphomicrobiales bacterium]